MLALYRSGSQAEALEHYAAVRRGSSTSWGSNRVPALREMQQRILRQDPRWSGTPPKPAPESMPAPPDRATAPRAAARRRRRGAVALVASPRRPCWRAATEDRRCAPVVAGAPGTGRAGSPARRPGAGGDGAALARRAHRRRRWARAGSRPPTTERCCGIDRTASGDPDGAGRAAAPSGSSRRQGDVWVARPARRPGRARRRRATASCSGSAVGASPFELAAADDVVWVADSREPTVTRIDARTGDVLGTTTLHGPRAASRSASARCGRAIPRIGRVARLDPRSGRVRDEIAVGSGAGPIVAGADGVWVANALDSTVSLIDPDRDAVTVHTAGPRHRDRDRRDRPARLGRRRRTRRRSPGSPATSRRGCWPCRRRRRRWPRTAAACSCLSGPDRASHRGGTLRVRTSLRLTDPDTHMCCNTPPALRNSSYDALLGISVAPGAVGTLVPNLALAVPRRAGRRPDVHVPPATGPALLDRTPRAGLGLPPRHRARAPLASPSLAGYLDALPGSRGAAPARHCDLGAAVRADDEAGTVTLHLARPDPELLWALAWSNFAPSPTDSGPVPGTGPYRIARLRAQRARRPAAQPVLPRARARRPAGRLPGPHRLGDRSASPAQLGRRRHRRPRRLHRRTHLTSRQIEDAAPPEPGSAPHRHGRRNRVRVAEHPRAAVRRHPRPPRARVRGRPRRTGAPWPGARPLCQILPATVPGHVPYCPYTRRPNEAGEWSAPDLARARGLIAASGTKGIAITYSGPASTLASPGSSTATWPRCCGASATGSSCVRSVLARVPGTNAGRHRELVVRRPAGNAMDASNCAATRRDQPLLRSDRRPLDAPRPAPPEQPIRPPPTGCGHGSTAGSPTRRHGSRDPAAALSVISARVGGWQYVPTVGVLPHRAVGAVSARMRARRGVRFPAPAGGQAGTAPGQGGSWSDAIRRSISPDGSGARR